VKTLQLTSPLTHGSAVSRAQHRLKSNVFGQDFQPGPMDSQFGEATARACKRAKYWLGLAANKQQGTYGDLLDALLSGDKKLPVLYALRRKQRIAASKRKPIRLKALAEAKRHVGEKESPPSSNRISFSNWYGIVGPWCAMFVSWCYVQAGSKAFAKGQRYAYVPYIVHDARAGANNLAIVHEPSAGDLVCFDWDHDGVADHVGLFDSWLSHRAGTFRTVEGNTAVGNESNGGAVMARERDRSEVLAFVHVGR
jgi:hypothetical protein